MCCAFEKRGGGLEGKRRWSTQKVNIFDMNGVNILVQILNLEVNPCIPVIPKEISVNSHINKIYISFL